MGPEGLDTDPIGPVQPHEDNDYGISAEEILAEFNPPVCNHNVSTTGSRKRGFSNVDRSSEQSSDLENRINNAAKDAVFGSVAKKARKNENIEASHTAKPSTLASQNEPSKVPNKRPNKAKKPYKSRFIEGSMSDRPSLPPPAHIVGEEIHRKWAEEDARKAKAADEQDISSTSDVDTPRPSSIYTFGSAVASAWKNVNTYWWGESEPETKTGELSVDDARAKAEARFAPDAKANAEKMYAELKKSGAFQKPTADLLKELAAKNIGGLKEQSTPYGKYTTPSSAQVAENQQSNVQDAKDLRSIVQGAGNQQDIVQDTEHQQSVVQDIEDLSSTVRDAEDAGNRRNNIQEAEHQQNTVHDTEDLPGIAQDAENCPKIVQEVERQEDVFEDAEDLPTIVQCIEDADDRPNNIQEAEILQTAGSIRFYEESPAQHDDQDSVNTEQSKKSRLFSRAPMHGLRSVTSRLNLRGRSRPALPKEWTPPEPKSSMADKIVQKKSPKATLTKQNKLDKRIESLERQLEKAKAERASIAIDDDSDLKKMLQKRTFSSASRGSKRKNEESEMGKEDEGVSNGPRTLKKRKSGESIPFTESSQLELRTSGSSRRATAQAATGKWRDALNLPTDAVPPVPRIPSKYQGQVARVASKSRRKRGVKAEDWKGWDDDVF